VVEYVWIYGRPKDKEPPKGHNTLLKASYWHLLEIPFHTTLQKVRGYVVRLTESPMGYFSLNKYH